MPSVTVLNATIYGEEPVSTIQSGVDLVKTSFEAVPSKAPHLMMARCRLPPHLESPASNRSRRRATER